MAEMIASSVLMRKMETAMLKIVSTVRREFRSEFFHIKESSFIESSCAAAL